MTKISTYGNDATISATDKIIGTDAVDGSTKNYTVGSLGSFFSTNEESLQNKTIDFSSTGNNTIVLDSSDVDYDNTVSSLSATNVKTAIDELTVDIATNASNIQTNDSNITTNTNDISTLSSTVSTNTSNINANASNIQTNDSNITTNTNDISTLSSTVSTNTSNINTNTNSIATLQTSKRDAFEAGEALSNSFNISQLTSDEYSVTDASGADTITINDDANTLVPLFGNRWVHAIVTGSGFTVTTSGSQSFVGTSSITTTGSYRFTKIATNSWMVS
jgi:ECM component-binding autotransporter adhesin